MAAQARPIVELDGETLSTKTLLQLSSGEWRIALSEAAVARVNEGRAVVDRVVETNEVVYGINTGFGNFASVVIPPGQLDELQRNLIRSHAAGVGEPLSRERSLMLLALRLNVLAKGCSGIRLVNVNRMLAAFNAGCVSVVPAQGTVGASGDLAPLSHLALGLMGEGDMWTPAGEIRPAAEVLAAHGLEPIQLHAKEGLAMINGTQLITALGAEALERAKLVALSADVVTALTLESLRGINRAFHPKIHAQRPHQGQREVAERIRSLIHSAATPSEIALAHHDPSRVQDAYSLRCAPQVHGVVHDTIRFVDGLLSVELNSATDNPMCFAGADELAADVPGAGAGVAAVLGKRKSRGDGADVAGKEDEAAEAPAPAPAAPAAAATAAPEDEPGFIISGGNFHGEYPAKALDYLAIGVHELANISERRVERLVNSALSELPPFLVPDGRGGLNSGFMIAHCTAAALVSENKVLTHPSSVDSISTSAAKEDHVSMGGFSARKALQVVQNVERVIAIELLCAAQAVEFLRPLRTTPALEAVHALVRTVAEPWNNDRYMAPDIEAVAGLLRSGRIWGAVQPYLS